MVAVQCPMEPCSWCCGMVWDEISTLGLLDLSAVAPILWELPHQCCHYNFSRRAPENFATCNILSEAKSVAAGSCPTFAFAAVHHRRLSKRNDLKNRARLHRQDREPNDRLLLCVGLSFDPLTHQTYLFATSTLLNHEIFLLVETSSPGCSAR